MNQKTEQTTPAKAKRRRYDEQFKRDAVALLEGGRGAAQLARELGVSQWNLRDGKAIFGAGGAGAGRQARGAQQAGGGDAGSVALAVEVADLRRELGAVCRQRDILKKPWPLLPRKVRTLRADAASSSATPRHGCRGDRPGAGFEPQRLLRPRPQAAPQTPLRGCRPGP